MTTKKPSKRVAKRPAAKKKSVTQDQMMAMWQKAMTPSEGHKRLEPIVGTFRTKTTFVFEPGAPPDVSEGSSVHRWVLGGRYVEQVYKGMSMGMPFEGIGFTGYDNIKKRYSGTWMDTFGTGFMHSVGTGKPSAAKMTFDSEATEPSGKPMRFENILKVKDKNRHSYEMWLKAPGGKRFRTMLVEYTRA